MGKSACDEFYLLIRSKIKYFYFKILEFDGRYKRWTASDGCNERFKDDANESRNFAMGPIFAQVNWNFRIKSNIEFNSIVIERFFDIPSSILPQIRSSSEIYGFMTATPLGGVPISGVSCSSFLN